MFSFRYLSICLLLMVSLLLGQQAHAMDPKLAEPEQSSIRTEQEEGQVDDTVLEMLLEEPKLCCPSNWSKLIPANSLAGLLLWSRIKILCQNLRPTAIC